jgi:HTH-type transcriptional regulator/antitoxin HigA
MKIKVIKTDQEYDQMCKRIYELIHSTNSPIEPETESGEELELLSLLVEDYEKRMNYKLNTTTHLEFSS